MTWFPDVNSDNGSSWFQRFCTSIIKCGRIPEHVAFIMDGNRRFAVKKSIERADGHMKGFDKLAETLQWCRDLGINQVTVYAFSIENFKRSKEEVDGLMEMARQKVTQLLEESKKLNEHGMCVRVIGELRLLPVDVQQLIAKVMTLTRHNTRCTLNVCLAYTSRHEICEAIKLCAQGVDEGIIHNSDITYEVIERCLYTSPPDLLVRTSGEVRLSDFLLLQSSFSVLSFIKVLWPDFNIWHLYAAILHYQSNYDLIQKVKMNLKHERLSQEIADDRISSKTEHTGLTDDSQEHYREKRLQRLANFYDFVHSVKTQYVDSLCDPVPQHTDTCILSL